MILTGRTKLFGVLIALLVAGRGLSSNAQQTAVIYKPDHRPPDIIAVAPPVNWAKRALARSLQAELGLPPVPYPTENPPTADKIKLGRKLFFDRRLSINKTMSCAMCHIPEQGFTNWEIKTAVGVEGRSGKRNAPTILNVAYMVHLFVDGRDPALETQYIAPLTARNEMANPSAGAVVALLKALSDYAGLFEKNFDGPPTLDRIGMALAAYQRSIVAAASPFDQWRYGGDKSALGASEIRGFSLFTGKAGCSSCHFVGEKSALFTDQQYHDIGYGWWREKLRQAPLESTLVEVAPGVSYRLSGSVVASVGDAPEPDLGRYEVTENPEDLWKFRTPSLRNVGITPPYMHDGGFATLHEVLVFYNDGGKSHKGLDSRIRPMNFNDQEMEDIEAFLRSLTSPGIPHLVGEARVDIPDNQ